MFTSDTKGTTVFFATTGQGLERATCSPEGIWSVDTVLSVASVSCATSDPNNPNVLYAGTKANGVWRSDDMGQSWQSCGMEKQWIKSLAVSPHDHDTIYAGTKGALMFISSDGGESWSELKGFRHIPNRWWWFSPAEPPDFRPYVIAIAISPTAPGVVLAGIEFGGVFRSMDHGKTWSRHLHGALRDCHSLQFHHADGNRVYQAGGTGGGVAMSLDGGRTFQRRPDGLAKHYGIVCAVDGTDPDISYVSVAASPFKAHGDNPETYLYRSSGDTGWEPIGWAPHPLLATPAALVTLKGAAGLLYAGLTNGEIWYTKDHGDHWEKLPFSFSQIWPNLLIL